MARARNIKPSFFKNELIGQADPLLGLLFISLWTLADKSGRLEDRPARIKAETFPYREGLDINGYLTELVSLGFIERYKSNDIAVIQIVNFTKHQTPHSTEKASELPEKSAQVVDVIDKCETVEVLPVINASASVNAHINVLIPDSLLLNPDSIKKTSAKRADIFPDIENRQIVEDWLTLRKTKKSPVTETAMLGIEREARKAGLSVEDALKVCCERGWAGFKAEWISPQQGPQNQTKKYDPLDFINKNRISRPNDEQVINPI